MSIETLAGLAAPVGGIAPELAVGAASHDGASFTDKNMTRWGPPSLSADADTLPDLDTLVARTRDVGRNNPLGSGARQTLIDNIIGTGPRLNSTPDYKALGWSKDQAEEWAGKWEIVFRSWAETKSCDITGQDTLAGLTTLVGSDGMMNGEALALPIWIPPKANTEEWGTRIQLVEADRLSNPYDKPDEQLLRGGIEIDQYGRPLAYNIRKTHPGDLWLGMFPAYGGGEWQRIPATTRWGRRRVIHPYAKERVGQTRGKPWYSAVLPQFKMLDQYQRAELKSAIVSALIAAFIKTPLDQQELAQRLGSDPTSTEYQSFLSVMKQTVAPLEGGAMIPLMPGTEIQEFAPNRPPTHFDEFITALIRQISVGLNMPYELVSKDFSKTNYSSARAALLEAWRHFRTRRQWLTQWWLQPVYELVMEEAVLYKRIDAPDFYQRKWAYCRAKWIWPGKGWVDPVKEAEASVLRMQHGLSTLEAECAEQGEDWQEVLEQMAREQAKKKELGIQDVPLQRSAAQPQQQQGNG